MKTYKIKSLTFIYLLLLSFSKVIAQNIWINEFSYDPAGQDTSEFVEIAGDVGINLSDYKLVFYNGNDSMIYSSKNLSGVISGVGKIGVTSFRFNNTIQNGSPDAIALVYNGTTLVQFISYEGTIIGKEGVALGQASEDVGVIQQNNANTIQATTFDKNNLKWELAPATKDSLNAKQRNISTAVKNNVYEKEFLTQENQKLIFDQDYNVTVYNIIGNLVYNGLTDHLSITKPGIYIVTAKDPFSSKIFKSKVWIP
ncbi:MAG: hypothetical protein U0V72_05525 [Cytophagales bacterium]